ncbi:putative pyruvate dehydrogenase complex dihydrolipoamide acetyltransferase [Gemella haemolysans]|uniref:Dihydrolipoamide acetyltransferase component of pyruvate dehydrogenase complex n=1 Tax=Gemella haemolysans TaxID=1379 RepID=A0A134A4P3_9BACL|nr:dihydrolipoamide acetyltransferase [Gemella haemolysans]KXB62706.1 putative pyruvate dehydrogenase complex dihydrolipoamide acetyltransferase [Gemella haemolysans]
MAVEVIMPKAGSEMEEGEIVQWFKQEGDEVKEGEILLEIVTDKVNMEVEAEASGTLLKIVHPAGSVVPVVQTIAWIGQAGEAVPGAGAAPAAAAAPVEETVVETKVEAAPAQEVVVFDNSGLRATPAARAYARENGIDLSQVKGTGAKGRVHKDDVVDYKLNAKAKISPLAARIAEVEEINTDAIVGTGPKGKIMKADVLSVLNGSASEAAASASEVAAPASAKSAKAPNENQWGVVETVPMSPMRKVISKRMSESYFSAPTFVVNVEVDMTELLALRKKVVDAIIEETGKKATVTDFISLAVIKSLMKHPYVNASLSSDEKEMYLHHYVNLSIAVGMDSGLVVPVIKGADKMSLKELVVASKEITTKALAGKLKPDEMADSTFTISNLGMYGVKSFVPIINQPNTAILGVSATVQKPVVLNGEVTVRPIMTLTLTADHRVVDGLEGAKFMKTLKEAIENPLSLLI